MHNPKAKQSKWLLENAVVSTCTEWADATKADGAWAAKMMADQALLGQNSDKWHGLEIAT